MRRGQLAQWPFVVYKTCGFLQGAHPIAAEYSSLLSSTVPFYLQVAGGRNGQLQAWDLCCVLLFLSCVCVCDLFLFLQTHPTITGSSIAPASVSSTAKPAPSLAAASFATAAHTTSSIAAASVAATTLAAASFAAASVTTVIVPVCVQVAGERDGQLKAWDLRAGAAAVVRLWCWVNPIYELEVGGFFAFNHYTLRLFIVGGHTFHHGCACVCVCLSIAAL